MRQRFKDIRISPKRLVMIKMVNQVLEDYMAQGYRLTLRQLYYQLVARNIIPNLVQEYQKLSSTLVSARMAGLTDWDAIEDRIRQPHRPYWVTGIPDAIDDTLSHYRLDRQRGQPCHLEIWTEKDAVSNILKRVSEHFHIYLMVNRGYSSCSAMYNSAKRMQIYVEPTKVLYVGDHDPSGLDMLRDINERLNEFEVYDIEVVPVALTREQVDEFHLPENPTKITDPRATWYMSMHGDASWELDALQPQALEQLMQEAVMKYLNEEQFAAMLAREQRDKKKLEEISEGFK